MKKESVVFCLALIIVLLLSISFVSASLLGELVDWFKDFFKNISGKATLGGSQDYGSADYVCQEGAKICELMPSRTANFRYSIKQCQNNSWNITGYCEVNQGCSNGTCICIEGAKRCFEKTAPRGWAIIKGVEKCSNGTWLDVGVCPIGCKEGACTNETSICNDTCLSLGYECGMQSVCGGQESCGNCGAGENCTNGKCFEIVYEGNQKNISKYSAKEAFLISDKNWKDVLPLVSLATWTGQEQCQRGYGTAEDVCVYPTLIYHEEDTSFDIDSIIYFMQQYSPSKVTIVGQTPWGLDELLLVAPELGAGLQEEQIKKIDFDLTNYLSYWASFDKVVYVEDNYELALLASTYASLLNAPLIIKGTELDTNESFENKKIICVGSVFPAGNSCSEQYNLEQLQQKYINMTNTDKIILVNPNDLDIKVNEEFQPEKSAYPISELYSKTSLSAPILASAKHELIIGYVNDAAYLESEINAIFLDIDLYLENKFNSLVRPEYLTIISSHLAIPDSIEFYSKRKIVDWQYASLDNINHSEKVGRILGISSSDVSSYISRDIFYNVLFNEDYPANQFSILAIGHSRPHYARDAEETLDFAKEFGYDGKCYNDLSSTTCVEGVSPSLSDYEKKQIITFADHGSPWGWGGTLDSSNLPKFDLAFTISHACSPNDIRSGLGGTFGPNVLRKGAIANSGSASLATALSGVCSKNNKANCLYDTSCQNQYDMYPEIYNNKLVWIKYLDGTLGPPEIFLKDISTDEIIRITNNQYFESNPSIFDNKIVWQDYRDGSFNIYLYDLNTKTETQITYDGAESPSIYGDKIAYQSLGYIFVYDLNTKTETQITSEPGMNPIIFENKIVYRRDYENPKIFVYDLNTKTETQITYEGRAENPSIYDDKIIWVDDSDGYSNLYLYNLINQIKTKITSYTNNFFFMAPQGIYESMIVWSDNSNGNFNVYLYDINTRTKTQITRAQFNEFFPKIYPPWIVWEDEGNINGIPSIYGYDLVSKITTELSFEEDQGVCISKTLPGSASVKYALENEDVSLGEIYVALSNDPWLDGAVGFDYAESHLFLADPTLKPRFKT